LNELSTYNSIGQLIEPEPISYSFNTPGWYLVLGLLLLIALIVALVQYRKYRKNSYRREALKQIENIVKTKSETTVFEINRLLKIIALKLFGREKVASLYGAKWFDFLISTMKQKEKLKVESLTEFSEALYNSEYKLNENKLNELVGFAITWVKNHDVKNV